MSQQEIDLSRRGFLKLLGVGAPAIAVAHKLGLIEKLRTYFFAPKGGWNQTESGILLRTPQVVALQLEKVRNQLPLLYQSDDPLFDMLATRGYTDRVSSRTMRFPMDDFPPKPGLPCAYLIDQGTC